MKKRKQHVFGNFWSIMFRFGIKNSAQKALHKIKPVVSFSPILSQILQKKLCVQLFYLGMVLHHSFVLQICLQYNPRLRWRALDWCSLVYEFAFRYCTWQSMCPSCSIRRNLHRLDENKLFTSLSNTKLKSLSDRVNGYTMVKKSVNSCLIPALILWHARLTEF